MYVCEVFRESPGKSRCIHVAKYPRDYLFVSALVALACTVACCYFIFRTGGISVHSCELLLIFHARAYSRAQCEMLLVPSDAFTCTTREIYLFSLPHVWCERNHVFGVLVLVFL